MFEIETAPGAQLWQVLTPEDVQTQLERGEITSAKELCRDKLRELDRLLTDVANTQEHAGIVSKEAWAEHAKGLAEEIRKWTELLDQISGDKE